MKKSPPSMLGLRCPPAPHLLSPVLQTHCPRSLQVLQRQPWKVQLTDQRPPRSWPWSGRHTHSVPADSGEPGGPCGAGGEPGRSRVAATAACGPWGGQRCTGRWAPRQTSSHRGPRPECPGLWVTTAAPAGRRVYVSRARGQPRHLCPWTPPEAESRARTGCGRPHFTVPAVPRPPWPGRPVSVTANDPICPSEPSRLPPQKNCT